MSRFWHRRVHDLHPYVPGEQPQIPGLIKLNTNELSYPPSPRALSAIADAAGDRLRLYPDPTAQVLRETIGARFGLGAAQVFVGNGSDEVLAHAFRALFRDDLPIAFPDVTYSFYPVYCGLFDLAPALIPVTEPDLRIDPARFDGTYGGVVIANPNAPTGIALTLSEIDRLCARHAACTVIVDEAYVDFGAESAAGLIARHDNLLVVQTLSKSRGLAGLRVGFALGHPALIEGLIRVKDSFNSYPLGALAQAGARAAIEDEAWTRDVCGRVIASRARLTEGLGSLGFTVLPSSANFVLARHDTRTATELMAALRARAVLVRHLSGERVRAWLRITVGTDEECDRLLATLAEILTTA